MTTTTSHCFTIVLGLAVAFGRCSPGIRGDLSKHYDWQFEGTDDKQQPPDEAGGESRFDCAGKTYSELASCLRLVGWMKGGTRLAILAPPQESEQFAKLTAWINADGATIEPRIPATPDDGSGATIFVTVGTPPVFSGDAIKAAFDNQLYYPQTGAMVPLKGYMHLYVPSVDDLSAALGGEQDRPDTRVQMRVPPVDAEPLLHDLAVASQAMGGSSLLHTTCTSDSRVLLPKGRSQRHALVVERCVDGATQNREIQILSPSYQVVEAKLVFDLGNRPSLAYIPSVVLENDRLLTRVRVFGVVGGAFEELEKSSDFVLLQGTGVLGSVISHASGSLDDNELAIVSFEAGYSLRTPASFPWILLGPHASTAPGKSSSLLGWYSAETDGNLEFARGFIPSYHDSPFSDGGSDEHSHAVNGILAGGGGLVWTGQQMRSGRVIPLGNGIFSPMIATAVQEAEWLGHARVGSLSVKFPMDQETCGARTQALRGAGLLLTVGAANDGRDVATMALCPQRLGPSPDLIVVGAAADGKMAAYSNFGNTTVDIAADGNASSGAMGTSFASPRVAYAAAQLAGEVPAASNAQIRMALLLSADLPPDGSELPVRCGGSLASDLTTAHLALNNLLSTDMQDRVPFSVAMDVANVVETHLLPVLPDSDAVRWDAVKRRVGILIRNEAVCADPGFMAWCTMHDWWCWPLHDQRCGS